MWTDSGKQCSRNIACMVEATAFGSKAIVEHLRKEGVEIESVNATGGISHKSTFVMQTLADILNMPINVVSSNQTCALGAAMFAAVAAGIYGTVEEVQKHMGSGFTAKYEPRKQYVGLYETLYQRYNAIVNMANMNRLTFYLDV